ncbi:LA2681 family HEPN domain-containing protein [Acinetobacter piscicola]|uniref:LA2681 family HEPN domain-containing protein n=1 Tax=Acinetobacter piscicola TaxID=2006115 RepID=UPI000B7F69E8|nr:LA2681 family HEPN domain-containing protein [Acinetobacter piscicola]
MKLELQKINEAINAISNSIDQCEWSEALFGSEIMFSELEKHETSTIKLHLLFNLAGQFIDVGSSLKNEIAVNKGLEILEQNYEHYEKEFGNNFFYNLANAKISIANNFGHKNSILNYKESQLYSEAKNLYWQVFKNIDKEIDPNLYYQNLINLANVLKQQYRFSEAMYIYEKMIQTKLDYPEAFINRSTCLEDFDKLLDHRNGKMIQEIVKGYEFAYLSAFTPTSYKPYYFHRIEFLRSQIPDFDEDDDKNKNLEELAEMSQFRQWCIYENLTLNIHGMYCSCISNERDDLTLLQEVISSADILQYEQYLNRMKAEFSLMRIMLYESKFIDSSKFDYESCYSELYDQEIINIKSERLRTCFRLCFSILDKLAIFLCQYFSFKIEKNTAFNNFWRQNKTILESKENFALIAINSIICDLNEQNGQFGFYKNWRNALEHHILFLVPDTFELSNDSTHTYVKITDFENSLLNLIQLTRSSIFSTVFAIVEDLRQKMPDDKNNSIEITIHKKEFKGSP